jgi:hypothetical protein
VEAALVDTTADAVRWSDHFDLAGGASPRLADEIVTLIIRPLVLVLEQEEANRAAAKEPAEQTADDLVWRGAAAFDRPLSQANRGEARKLFEKALMLNPRNVWALSRLAHVDITDVMNYPGPDDEAKLARAEQLLNAAASIGPNDMTRYAGCMLLRLQARFDEAISICGEVIGNLLTRAFVYKEIGLDTCSSGNWSRPPSPSRLPTACHAVMCTTHGCCAAAVSPICFTAATGSGCAAAASPICLPVATKKRSTGCARPATPYLDRWWTGSACCSRRHMRCPGGNKRRSIRWKSCGPAGLRFSSIRTNCPPRFISGRVLHWRPACNRSSRLCDRLVFPSQWWQRCLTEQKVRPARGAPASRRPPM